MVEAVCKGKLDLLVLILENDGIKAENDKILF